MQFGDQYLQLGTALPSSHNIYGLGEHLAPLKLPNRTYTLWNADIGNPQFLNVCEYTGQFPCARAVEVGGMGMRLLYGLPLQMALILSTWSSAQTGMLMESSSGTAMGWMWYLEKTLLCTESSEVRGLQHKLLTRLSYLLSSPFLLPSSLPPITSLPLSLPPLRYL